ncbi:MAG: TIGR04211 family SH3 domain-containing protein [Desulfovibrionales bacterium]
MKYVYWSVLFVFLFAGTSTADARTVYVSDSFEITMRTGPSNQNKILNMLRSGERLEVLDETEDWLQIRTPNEKEGWVLKRFTMTEVPKAARLAWLQREHEKLKESSKKAAAQADVLREQNRELKKTLEKTQNELESVSTDYRSLRQDAANVMELKKEYASTQEQLNAMTSKVSVLSTENKELKSSSSLRWFLSGAGVVFGAWLFGFIMGRVQRRRRSSIQF